MSTRCQVLVKQEGLDWEQKIMLYHHCDGYPEYIVPKIKEAYDLAGDSWCARRAGKVASFLCAVDPGSFEPEAGFDLHGDINCFYELFCVNQKWDIQINEYTGKGVKVIMPRQPLENALETRLKLLGEEH